MVRRGREAGAGDGLVAGRGLRKGEAPGRRFVAAAASCCPPSVCPCLPTPPPHLDVIRRGALHAPVLDRHSAHTWVRQLQQQLGRVALSMGERARHPIECSCGQEAGQGRQGGHACPGPGTRLGKGKGLHVQVVGLALGALVADHHQHRQRLARGVGLAHGCVGGGQRAPCSPTSLRLPLPKAPSPSGCKPSSHHLDTTMQRPPPPTHPACHTGPESTGRSRAAGLPCRKSWRGPGRQC